MPRHVLPPGPGRPKGSQNKATIELKDAIFKALHAGDGATAYMMRLKEERPELYTSLLKGFIPKDVNLTADVAGVVTIVRTFVAKEGS